MLEKGMRLLSIPHLRFVSGDKDVLDEFVPVEPCLRSPEKLYDPARPGLVGDMVETEESMESKDRNMAPGLGWALSFITSRARPGAGEQAVIDGLGLPFTWDISSLYR